MRVFRIAVPLILALSLSACSASPLVVKKSKDPRYAAEVDFPMPPGYRHGLVLKPHVLKAPSEARAPISSAPAPDKVSWNEIGDLDAWTSGAPEEGEPVSSFATRYNADVSVFPLEAAAGDVVVYDIAEGADDGAALRGRLAEKVYFAHASAQIGGKDKAKLRRLAKQARKDNEVEITVVGHASRRVDGVQDPVRRKMINFVMAQKRADAVTRELKKAGLRPAWVRAVSKGDEESALSVPPGMTQEDADRRAEVYADQ